MLCATGRSDLAGCIPVPRQQGTVCVAWGARSRCVPARRSVRPADRSDRFGTDACVFGSAPLGSAAGGSPGPGGRHTKGPANLGEVAQTAAVCAGSAAGPSYRFPQVTVRLGIAQTISPGGGARESARITIPISRTKSGQKALILIHAGVNSLIFGYSVSPTLVRSSPTVTHCAFRVGRSPSQLAALRGRRPRRPRNLALKID